MTSFQKLAVLIVLFLVWGAVKTVMWTERMCWCEGKHH
jgi:hypothetical protein